MSKANSFERLEVWQLAREQAREIYALTSLPLFDFKFASQANASSGSVMDNIAEGFNRYSNKEFVRFLVIARGSNGEVRSQIIRMFDQKLLSCQDLEEKLQYNEILGRKLTALIKHLRKTDAPVQQ